VRGRPSSARLAAVARADVDVCQLAAAYACPRSRRSSDARRRAPRDHARGRRRRAAEEEDALPRTTLGCADAADDRGRDGGPRRRRCVTTRPDLVGTVADERDGRAARPTARHARDDRSRARPSDVCANSSRARRRIYAMRPRRPRLVPDGSAFVRQCGGAARGGARAFAHSAHSPTLGPRCPPLRQPHRSVAPRAVTGRRT
jgi:hypothetical protein